MFKRGDLVRFRDLSHTWTYSTDPLGKWLPSDAYETIDIPCWKVPILEVVIPRPGANTVFYVPSHNLYFSGLLDHNFELLTDDV